MSPHYKDLIKQHHFTAIELGLTEEQFHQLISKKPHKNESREQALQRTRKKILSKLGSGTSLVIRHHYKDLIKQHHFTATELGLTEEQFNKLSFVPSREIKLQQIRNKWILPLLNGSLHCLIPSSILDIINKCRFTTEELGIEIEQLRQCVLPECGKNMRYETLKTICSLLFPQLLITAYPVWLPVYVKNLVKKEYLTATELGLSQEHFQQLISDEWKPLGRRDRVLLYIKNHLFYDFSPDQLSLNFPHSIITYTFTQTELACTEEKWKNLDLLFIQDRYPSWRNLFLQRIQTVFLPELIKGAASPENHKFVQEFLLSYNYTTEELGITQEQFEKMKFI